MTTAWLPQGTVYGTLMNFKNEHAALAAQMHAAPYKAAPQAPVLYIKTANTFSAHGSAIALPPKVLEVQVRCCAMGPNPPPATLINDTAPPAPETPQPAPVS